MSKEEVKKYIDDRKEEIQKEKDWVINKEKKAMEVVKWCMENVK
jgi:polyhydroxyalkanoate synthesis regulator phasin